ncbi:acyl-CoA thioesterase [Thermoflavimicrobium dichotomicum]|uniref:Acyl-CoA hydrolase n=1 Tax=Thermoflavimicrobium dichotomicum TaxID=46223 RepID=A0A1I3UKG3_9BACL|nr:acyl-CoA thioesterase [Thermoflavimicrobium dichotomicum]SFJ84008.1 Acyl-CoA hydrolase [Thermoflavimicrobium dichotomicum]
MESRTVSESRVIKTGLVLPPDTNQHGTIFGGKVMALIDEVGAISAMRHAQKLVVTASIDSVHFINPAKLGDILTLESFVTWTGKTSMEVFVRVTSENPKTQVKKLTTTSFLTFVAIDENGKPSSVPQIIPETEEEKWLFETAVARRERRHQSKKEFESFLEL